MYEDRVWLHLQILGLGMCMKNDPQWPLAAMSSGSQQEQP